MTEENFFDKFGLEVAEGNVEVGQTYPIYGMITEFLNDEPGSVVVQLNFSIEAKLSINDADKIQLLKERSFEPGIFISTILSNDEGKNINVECQTVVFGRKQEFQA